MDTSNDFREAMVSAVAYRMIEIWPQPKDDCPDGEKARRMVRDAMKKGTGSRYWAEVSRASLDLLKPVLGVVLPVLPTITSAVIQVVQSENQRGEGAEATVTRRQRSETGGFF